MNRVVQIPWPPRCLSPNAKSKKDVFGKARARKKYKNDCMLACLAAKLDKFDCEAVVAEITFHPTDNRHRDLDNCLAHIKNGLDGIAAHIGVDDSRWGYFLRMGEPVKGGIITIEFTPSDMIRVPFMGTINA